MTTEKIHSIKKTDKETLAKWFKLMVVGRAIDDRAPNYLKQAIGWSYHAPYAGHDGIQLAIGQVFDKEHDHIFPYYRDMLTSLSAGISADELILNGISKDTDVAGELGVSLTDYHSMLMDVNSGHILAVEDLTANNEDAYAVYEGQSSTPFTAFSEQRFQHALAECIKTLPERESLVLSLYYDEELNLREIGEVLDVSESRVSQIHSQAMHRAKARMHAWLDE